MSRRLARRATEALIRQEMDMHPVERDDYPDDRRIRDIKKALADCEQEVTDDAVIRQYRYEVGHDPDKGLVHKILAAGSSGGNRLLGVDRSQSERLRPVSYTGTPASGPPSLVRGNSRRDPESSGAGSPVQESGMCQTDASGSSNTPRECGKRDDAVGDQLSDGSVSSRTSANRTEPV